MAQAKDPIVGIIYGVSGIGKTTDCIFSFPNAFFFSDHGALKPAMSVAGIEIPLEHVQHADRLNDITKKMRTFKPGQYDTVVADDFTIALERTWNEYETGTGPGGRKYSGFDIFKVMQTDVFEFRECARRLGINFIANAHEGVPHINKLTGRFIRGGPKMPGQLPELLPTVFDLVIRMVKEDVILGYPRVYVNDPDDDQWLGKDRDNIVIGREVPTNLRMIMTMAGGYKLSRPKGMEWMDAVVEKVAVHIQELFTHGNPSKADFGSQIVLPARAAMTAKYTSNLLHQNWVIKDALDLTILRRQLNARLTSLFGA